MAAMSLKLFFLSTFMAPARERSPAQNGVDHKRLKTTHVSPSDTPSSPLPVAAATATAHQPMEANNIQPDLADFASTSVIASIQTTHNVAPMVSQPNEPLHDLQASSIASVTQESFDISLHDHFDLGSQRDAQRPSATPLVPSTTTSQQTGAHSIDCAVSSHLQPIYHSPIVYTLPASLEIDESDLDKPITITQAQLMAFSPDARAKILHLVATRQASAPVNPHIIPVESQMFKYDYVAILEAQQAILRSKNQAVAHNVHTSAQEEQAIYADISIENAATSVPVIANCTAAVYIAPLPIYTAPQVEIIIPESTIIRARSITSYIQFAPARLIQNTEGEAMPMASVSPAPFAPSSSYSLDSAPFDSEFVFNHSSLPSSITARIVAHSSPEKLALEGSPQHAIYKALLAISLRKPLAPPLFNYPAHLSVLSSANSAYIAFISRFLHLAAKNIPQHPTPIDVIIYPPCPLLQPMHIISLINFAIYLIIFVFYNLFSAVRTIATTLAPFYKSPARTSRQFRSTSLAQVVISSASSMQATTVYFAHFFACHSIFSIIALVLSSKRSLINLFKGIIALSQSSSRIFALGYNSISKASPRPLKPDKGFSDHNGYIRAPSGDFATSNRPSALVGSWLGTVNSKVRGRWWAASHPGHGKPHFRAFQHLISY